MRLKFITALILISFKSCFPEVDCEESASFARKNECLLIFNKLPVFTSPHLEAEGRHLYTKKKCICEDTERWWTQYDDLLVKGDTIIKRKGELVFSIHKKDTVLNFNWECEGKIYK